MYNQKAKTFASTLIRYWSDKKVSDQCPIDVDPRAFAIWVYGEIYDEWQAFVLTLFLLSLHIFVIELSQHFSGNGFVTNMWQSIV